MHKVGFTKPTIHLNSSLTPLNQEGKGQPLPLPVRNASTQESDWAVRKKFSDFNYLLHINWNIKMSKTAQRGNSMFHTHPGGSYFGDLNWLFLETVWMATLVEGGWSVVVGGNASRAVPWGYKGMHEGMLLQSTAASYIHISAISLYNFKFKAIYTHVYSSNIQGNKWAVSILAPKERPNVLRLA